MNAMETVGSKITKAKAIIGVSVALGWFVLIAILEQAAVFPIGFIAGTALTWVMFLLIVFWVTGIEGSDLSSLGFRRPTVGTLGWALLAVVTTYVFMGVYYRLIAPALGLVSAGTPAAVSEIRSQPLYEILITCLTAGLVEEQVFRFYPISRLNWLTGSRWIASIIPMIVFVGLHVPSFGLAQVIPVAIGAIVLTVLYWLRRDYLCNALAHFLIDFAAFGLTSLAARHAASLASH